MKIELELNDKIIMKYAEHLGYDANYPDEVAEDEGFKDALAELIEDTIDAVL